MSSTQSAVQTLQKMMKQYCNLYRLLTVYPDMKKLREVLTQLSGQKKLHLLQQKYSGWRTPLHRAAEKDHTEIISTLLTSLQSSADRLKLLMVIIALGTPLHYAAYCGHTESVKMILDSLTADQQIQLMSVQWWDKTAIQIAESEGDTATVRVLREYQHRAENLMRERRQEQQGMSDEKIRQRLSGINAQSIIAAVVICYMIIPLQGLHGNINNNVE